MKVAIILNGVSKRKKKFYKELLPNIQKKFDVTVFETQFSGHANQLAQEATLKNFDCLLAAGGDGTLHQVLNGILDKSIQSSKLPSLGVIPLGSGNDFASASGLLGNEIIELLILNNPKPTDIGLIHFQTKDGKPQLKYFINVCSIGMGPATVIKMESLSRNLGSNVRYLYSILHTFITHKPQALKIKTTNWNWDGKARVLAIANGKSFGNKIFIAPDSLPDDGIFNCFLAGEVPLLKFLVYLQQLKSKIKIRDVKIQYHQSSAFEINASEETFIEADGELVGYLPCTVMVNTLKINFMR